MNADKRRWSFGKEKQAGRPASWQEMFPISILLSAFIRVHLRFQMPSSRPPGSLLASLAVEFLNPEP